MERSLAPRRAGTAAVGALGRALFAAAAVAMLGATAAAQAVDDYRGRAPWAAASPPASVGSDTVVWLQADGAQAHPGVGTGEPTHVILFQDPLPGEPKTGTLTLFVVDGVPVPDLTGMNVSAAQKVLAGLGLEIAIADGSDPSSVQESQIASHSPDKTSAQRAVGEPITIGGTVGVILVSPFGQTSTTTCVAVAVGAAVVGFGLGALASAASRRRRRPEG